MQSLSFWRKWPRPYQIIFWFLSLISFLAIGLLWYAYFQNPSMVFQWQQFQQLQSIETTIRTFSVGLFDFSIPANSLVLFESVGGSDYQPADAVLYFFVLCLGVGSLTLITIISTLKRFSFFIGMSLMILLIISLKLESLQLYGLTGRVPTILILALIGGLAFYFQSFRTETTFVVRLISFYIIGIFLAILFLASSSVVQPLLHVAVNGLFAGMILGILFVLMVAHELVAMFIDIVTKTKTPTKSARHFYAISAIYFINLILSYLIKEGYLNLNFWVINSFFLLTLSGILGVWGFNRREPLYQDFLSSPALAVFACLSLMSISFSVIAFFLAAGSNTMIEGMQDLILYAHLGYGLIFLVYVTANFSPMLMANLPVYKILYKPDTMPFFTFRFGAAIATFAFLSFASTWGSYINQGYAAYYNAYGDLYWGQGAMTEAEGYYKKSLLYRNQNHHAHYALGTIYSQQLEPSKSRYELATACESSPSEIAFINLAEVYGANGNPLATSLVLTDGLKKFPQSAILQNALALTYAKFNNKDSALYFFQRSRASGEIKDMAETNLLAASAKFSLSFPADSLLRLLKSNKPGAKSNALALANGQQLLLNVNYQLPSDTVLTVREAVLLNNQLINQKSNVDTTLLKQVETLARKPSNDSFKDELLMAVATCFYEKGLTKKAGELAREVAYRSGNGKYFQLLGLWLLEQENPTTAARYFKIAAEKSIPKASWYEAISWLEADSLEKALPILAELQNQNDTLQSKQAKNLWFALNSSEKDISNATDENKFLFTRYKIKLIDTAQFNRVVSSIQNSNIKASALLDQSKKWFAQDETSLSTWVLKSIKDIAITDKKLYEDIRQFSLMMIANQENWKALEQQLNSEIVFEPHTNHKIYLEALLAEAHENEKEAKEKFSYLANATIQSEEIALASARFFLKDSTDRLKPYSIIVNGLLAKPNSIKLLKVYVKEAAVLGFDDESQEALDKLRKYLRPAAFNQYIKENPDFFDIAN